MYGLSFMFPPIWCGWLGSLGLVDPKTCAMPNTPIRLVAFLRSRTSCIKRRARFPTLLWRPTCRAFLPNPGRDSACRTRAPTSAGASTPPSFESCQRPLYQLLRCDATHLHALSIFPPSHTMKSSSPIFIIPTRQKQLNSMPARMTSFPTIIISTTSVVDPEHPQMLSSAPTPVPLS